MRAPLTILVSALAELDVPLEVESPTERKFIQNNVYIAQAFGADFGYDFMWVEDGPHSSKLAENADEAALKLKLDPYLTIPPLVTELKQMLCDARGLLVPRDGTRREEWAAALAAFHFLKYRAGVEDPLTFVRSLTKKRPLSISELQLARQSIERSATAV